MGGALTRNGQRVSALLVGTILGFALLEAGARGWVRYRITRLPPVSAAAADVLLSDPSLGYRYKPDLRDDRGGLVTNHYGVREQDWAPEILQRSRVILNLGDSITFGLNLSRPDEVYGKVLQSLLNRRGNGSVIVYNAGVSGYNSAQELAFIEELSRTLKFDAVLVGFCLNDSAPALQINPEMRNGVVWAPAAIRSVGDLFSRRALDHVVSYTLAKEAVKSIQRRHPSLFPARWLWHNALVGSAGWEQMKLSLLEMKRLLDAKHVPLTIAIFPYEHQLHLTAESNLAQQDLLRFCRANRIDCVDLYDAFRENRDRIGWDAEGTHFDARGHRVAGEALYAHFAGR
jgi:hypothetical protein